LYAAVEGRPPYQRPSAVGTLMALAADEPEPPHRAGVLRPVLDGLLRKDPDRRIDAEEARRRLRRAVGAPGERARRPRPWAVVSVLAVLAAAGAAVVLVATTGRPSSPGPTSAPVVSAPVVSAPIVSAPVVSAPVVSAPVGSAPAARSSAAASSERPDLPSGWIDYHDPTGFSVYVPNGWTRSQKGSIVYFRGAGRVLGIDQTTHPNMNPVADWRGKADYRVAHGDFPGYREVHIRAVEYFVKAADWEFTFDGSHSRQHVNNRGVVVNDHQAYGIYWQTPDASWGSAAADLQLVFRSFRPRSS
jgi:hypothetical protein